jgi:hypothetical protein
MIDIPSYAADLMKALGPGTPAVDWVGYDGELGAWCVRFDDGADLYVEWFAEQDCLVLHAELGAPPAAAQLQAYQAVLAYNALWRDNAGARIGMVSASGELALMFELPARELTLDQLQRAVLGLKSVAEPWRRGIADPGSAAPGAPPSVSALLNRA